MRRMEAGWRVRVIFVALLVVFPGAGAVRAGVAGKSKGQAEIVPTGTFSGAYLAGRAAEADNSLPSAIAYYSRAIAFDPNKQELQKALFMLLLAQGKLHKALPLAKKLYAQPDVGRFSGLALAVDAFRKKKFAEARRWLKTREKTDLDGLVFAVMAGWAKLGEGKFKDALATLEDFSAPDWADLFKTYQRALMLVHGGKNDEAEQAFQAILDVPASRLAAPRTSGRIAEVYASFLSSRGKNKKALNVLDKAEKSGAIIPTAQVLREKISASKALKPLVFNPADGVSELFLNISAELAEIGNTFDAELYLQYALALRPNSDVVLVQLGQVAEAQKDAERAIGFYRRIGKASPWARIADFQIGLNLAELKRYDESISSLKEILEANPSDMRAYLVLGDVYLARQDYRAAAKLYDRAVEHIKEPTGQDWGIFYQRGIAYEHLKEWKQAEPNFETALRLSPNQPLALNGLGYSWVDRDMNLDKAIGLIRRAMELNPGDGYIVDSLGWAYYKLGQYDKAAEQLERAVSLLPNDATLNDHLGDVYWRVGRKLEAHYQWLHARDFDPDPDLSATLRQKLSEGLPPVGDKGRVDTSRTPTDHKAPAGGDGSRVEADKTPPTNDPH